jgi:peptidoglycan hydrolase-like protein with peptidoglycan-binding domain
MKYKKHIVAMVLSGCLSALLSGCLEVKEDVKQQLPALVKGPADTPFRSMTNFTEPLRCMDSMLIEYGVYDISLLVEDLKDDTGKVKAGAKDMLISAVSEMTRRSQAARLVAFGSDSGNLVSFLSSAHSNSAYATVPQYDIRGSISQLDKSVVSKDVSGGLDVGDVGIGGARTANASIMGVDLSVISTRDYSVLPGVTAKNSIAIYKQGSGVNAAASVGKFGLNFDMKWVRAEGDDQALRNLMEIAAIELVGKLTKTPYWLCLGADPNKEEIKDEVYDWFYELVADKKIVAYFQQQLHFRNVYNGPLDGVYNSELTQAVSAYQSALGMEANGNVGLELFSALLNKPVPALAKPVSQPTKPVAMAIALADGPWQALLPGAEFAVEVKPAADAHVYCYYQDEHRQVQRIFPNRFQRDTLVRAGATLRLPGNMNFKLTASRDGNNEKLACLSAPRNIVAQLPALVKGADFTDLPVDSLDAVQEAFRAAAGSALAVAVLEINVE